MAHRMHASLAYCWGPKTSEAQSKTATGTEPGSKQASQAPLSAGANHADAGKDHVWASSDEIHACNSKSKQ